MMTAEAILDKHITWNADLEECAFKFSFINAMEEYAEQYARAKLDEACEAQLLNFYTHIDKNGLILAGERVHVRKPEFKP